MRDNSLPSPLVDARLLLRKGMDCLKQAMTMQPLGACSGSHPVGTEEPLPPHISPFISRQRPCTCSSAALPRRKTSHRSRTSLSGRRAGPLNAHSQIVSRLQPEAVSAAQAVASRVRLPSIFASQNSRRVEGSRNIGQSWPCQKHPWINTTDLRPGSTMSGHPASLRSCNRKRKPRAWRPRRINISGLVSRPRIRLILKLRRSGEWTSPGPSRSPFIVRGRPLAEAKAGRPPLRELAGRVQQESRTRPSRRGRSQRFDAAGSRTKPPTLPEGSDEICAQRR